MARESQRTLKGFRDFLPARKRVRDLVQRRLVEVFERFGFEPLETPSLEYAELILGKYGQEADRLVYTFEDRGGRRVALPYDQTVPTARVLAQYRAELPRLFRRYAIRNVFRAEKPQRGRYREFTQCDIDLFGSKSALSDAEILACTHAAFRNVGLEDVVLRVNDRTTLVDTLRPFEQAGVGVLSIVQSVDKLDKMDRGRVAAELCQKGLSPAHAEEALARIEAAEASDDLKRILEATAELGVPAAALEYQSTLARGLDYYTGMIVEAVRPGAVGGSLAGGGRYDGLIEELGGPDVPAVGLAFGFDRIVDSAIELGLVPERAGGAQILVTVFDEEHRAAALATAALLRSAGLRTELYPGTDKLGKQLKLAAQKGIPVVVVVGPEEASRASVTLREMGTGRQETIPRDELVQTIRSRLGPGD